MSFEETPDEAAAGAAMVKGFEEVRVVRRWVRCGLERLSGRGGSVSRCSGRLLCYPVTV